MTESSEGQGMKSMQNVREDTTPCVVVSYTQHADIVPRFAKAGGQVAAGVPLMCGEPADYRAFRIGLFGLDKLADVDGTVARLEKALTQATA